MTGWNHGTMAGAKRHGCRCEPCLAAYRAYNRSRYLRSKVGVRSSVDAEPVRRHVQALIDDGWTWMQLEVASGVHRTGIKALIIGQKGKPPSKRILPRTAKALLAVRHMQPIEGAAYPAYRVQRRIQALHALGYDLNDLGHRLGITSHTNMHALLQRTRCTGAMYARVDALYQQLHMTPGPSTRARARARRLGWVPPLAWDDIDDPNETPAPIAELNRRKPRAEVVHDALELWNAGYSPLDIAQALQMQIRSIERTFHRHGTPIPWPQTSSGSNAA